MNYIEIKRSMNSSRLDDIREIIKRRRLGLFGHVAPLQPQVPATSVLSASCAASDDTPPQPGCMASLTR